MTGVTTDFPRIRVSARAKQCLPPLATDLSRDWQRARIATIKQTLEPQSAKAVVAWRLAWDALGAVPMRPGIARIAPSLEALQQSSVALSFGSCVELPVPRLGGLGKTSTRLSRRWKLRLNPSLLAEYADLGGTKDVPRLVEHFELRREQIGRVRDIDRERGVFLAVLSDRATTSGQEDSEVIGRFPLTLLDHGDRDRIAIGLSFTLATGRHSVVTSAGEALKPSLQTRILLHRPRPIDPTIEKDARAEGRRIRARL